jgi:hypothetical protein
MTATLLFFKPAQAAICNTLFESNHGNDDCSGNTGSGAAAKE